MNMKLLIVHPFSFIDSVPTLISLLQGLQERGWEIDVYCAMSKTTVVPSLFNGKTRIHNLPKQDRKGVKARLCELKEWRQQLIKACLENSYDLVISVDPLGLAVGGAAAQKCGIPSVYFSLELIYWKELRSLSLVGLKLLEARYIRHASAVIIQDEIRAQSLLESCFANAIKVLQFPNAWRGGVLHTKSSALRARLNIPPETCILLHAGSCARWTMAAELAEVARTWRADKALVIQSRFAMDGDAYYDRILKAVDNRKVFLLRDPCPSDKYLEFISGADIGVALYACQDSPSLQTNLRITGKSSGKLSSYLQAGLPVIANTEGGLKPIIERYDCGNVVTDPGEIENAAQSLMVRYRTVSNQAKTCFTEEFASDAYLPRILDFMQTLRNSARV